MVGEVELSDEQIDDIAERAAERALEKVYAQVGKSVVTKMLWLVGVVTLCLLVWLAGKDAMRFPT